MKTFQGNHLVFLWQNWWPFINRLTASIENSTKHIFANWCSYRDFKNKLQKVDGDFRPFRSSEMHEILCLAIIRVGFLKTENKSLVIEVVEEL